MNLLDGAGSSTSSNTFRNNKFRTALLQRDNHCVVSRAYDALEACHILAFKWWDESHRDELPNDIKSTVLGWTNQINDIRNGILLSESLAKDFDQGMSLFHYVDGKYRVVALEPSLEELDGKLLDVNMRARADGSTWWEAYRPDEVLLAFHLRNSVFKRMIAGGSDDSESYDD